MKISKTPYPLIACRYSCNYIHEGQPLLCVYALKLRRGIRDKLMEVVHAGNSAFYTNELIISGALEFIQYRAKKIIYAIEDPAVLRELLGIKHLRYDAPENEGSFEYFPLGEHFSSGMQGEIELFGRHGIELITGGDIELLRLFSGKKK